MHSPILIKYFVAFNAANNGESRCFTSSSARVKKKKKNVVEVINYELSVSLD